MGLQIASVAYGALLGVFLLGVLTRRANQIGAMVGMLCGFVTELYLWLGTRVPWTWYVVIGTTGYVRGGIRRQLIFMLSEQAGQKHLSRRRRTSRPRTRARVYFNS